MAKLTYEILAEVDNAKNEKEAVNILRRNDNQTLRNVLQGAFHPAIQYEFKDRLSFRPGASIAGMGYETMQGAMDKIYIFVKGSKRVNKNLGQTRRVQILLQILEALEYQEANVYMNMILKDLRIKNLTYDVVKEAFPGLLP